jgi:hypothetical protein
MPSTGKIYAEADVATWSSGIAAGAGLHLPVGDYSTADYRSAIRFPAPPGWAAWTAITKATITVFISDFNHVSPDSSTIYCSPMYVTAPIWTKSEGTQSCESGFTGSNNTQYDDIAPRSIDRVSFSSGTTANAAKTLDVTAAMRYYWGNGANPTLKPVFVFDNNGTNQWTELWSRNKGGNYVAYLSIDYESNTPPNAPTLNSPNGAVVLSATPTLNFTPSDPQGDAAAAYHYQVATDPGFGSLYEDLAVTGPFTNGVAINRVVQNALSRGSTYYWRVQTSDAEGYGPWATGLSFSIKANPTVTVKTPRKMTYDTAPRLIVEWTCDQPQYQWRVTATGGYTSGIQTGGDQSHTLNLALTNGSAVSVTVEVWTTEGLYNYSSRSFTPRWGLTTHKRTLADTPINWQAPTVVATVPQDATNGNCQLIVEYGTAAAAADAAPTGWYTSFSSVPKTPYLHWRAWFIPNHVTGPTLDSLTIAYDKTVATLDKWGVQAVWPWEANGGIPARFSVDPGEAVYGTRSLRLDCDGGLRYICSTKVKVREGRSYVLSGLMRSQGNSGAYFRLQDAGTVYATSRDPKNPNLGNTWTPGVLTDWERYKTQVWKAPADMDVFVLCLSDTSVNGSTAWFDGIKLEESIVATPWNPSTVGATVVDTGGVQIDGPKGGVFRYKGTGGALRDVVEGGTNGLVFGGDTPVYSPKANTIRIGSGSGSDEAVQVGDDAELFDVDVANAMGIRGITTPADAQFFLGGNKDVSLYRSGAGMLRTPNSFQVDGELRPGVNTWHRSTDNYNRFHFASGGRSYYESGNGHEFRGASDNLLALLDAGGSLQVQGGLFEAAGRVLQPMGLTVQRGIYACPGGTGASAYGGVVTYPFAFSVAPTVIVSMYTHNGWYAVVNTDPLPSYFNCVVAYRLGTTATLAACRVGWLAIGIT